MWQRVCNGVIKVRNKLRLLIARDYGEVFVQGVVGHLKYIPTTVYLGRFNIIRSLLKI